MASKRCSSCGMLIREPKPYQRVCIDCANPTKRQRNAEWFREIQQRVANAKRSVKPAHSGLTLSDAVRLSGQTRGRLSYGKIMDRYGAFDFNTAQDFMIERGEIEVTS